MELFGTSGIRGIADKNLLQLSLKIGLAVGNIYHNVVVGCDTRTSSPAMKHAIISGLLTAGSRCSDGGVIPTPTLAFATRKFDAGVMITASHNPPEYNGIKLVNPDGSAFNRPQQKQIEEIVFNNSPITTSWQEIKENRTYDRAIEEHIDFILQNFPQVLNLKVVVDNVCGTACAITPQLLTRLGCKVISMNSHPSGFFPHDVEPTEANLTELIKVTEELGAELGIAHDGDSDRMMVVDDKGRFIPGDKLLAIFAREVGTSEIVTTIDASMVIEEMGFKIIRTMVGDNYVSEELKKGGIFGGEPSGSWVFPTISLCPDGIYAAAQIAAIASQQKLSPLVDNIPCYPLIRGNISHNGIVMSRLEKQLIAMNPISVTYKDGIKLNFEDGWVLVRNSGTEPKIRITAEAKSETQLRHLWDNSIKIIKDFME
jgi:phosphoglucosamine mutase